ncbi:MAG: hypothetical protein J5642_04620 [Bacteroidales bacterium]|nr:hypothetical protein [Bacteroidales bacterium]
MKNSARLVLFLWMAGSFFSIFPQNDPSERQQLEGIEVHGGVNPAHRLVQGAASQRIRNGAFSNTSFHYVAYHKTTIFPVSFSDSLSLLEQQHLFLTESVSEVFYKNPNRKYEKMVASKTSGLDNPVFNMVLSRLQFQNLYESEFLEILQVQYLSPISDGAVKRYDFRLTDTVVVGSDTAFVIEYQPLPNMVFKSLKGRIWIQSGSFAVSRIEATPVDKEVLLQVSVTQDYCRQTNGTWFPEKQTATFTLPRISTKGLFLESSGVSSITVKNIEIDLPLKNSDFGIYDVEELVTSKKSSEELLVSYRDSLLDDKELRTYDVLDSLGRKMRLEKKLNWLPSLMRGCLPLGPVDLDLASIVNYTYYEGWRFGLGLYSNQRLARFVTFGGYFAYGLKDKDWKWGVKTDWELYRKYSIILKIRFFDDIVESGCTQLVSRDENGLLNGEFYRHWIITKFDKSRALQVKFQMRPDKNFTLSLSSSYSQNHTLFDYSFLPVQENTIEGRFYYNNFYVRAGLRFAYHETTYRSTDFTLYERSKYPALQLQYEHGFSGVFGSDFSYQKINARIYHLQRYKILGYSEISLSGGWIDRSLPYSLLYVMPAGYEKLGFYGQEQFAAMRPNEFVADSYVAIFLRHNFGKMLKGKFSPQIVLCQNIGFGWLRHAGDHGGVEVQSMRRGYFETGLMIDRLLSVKDLLALGIGAFYRYGPYGFSEPLKNLAVKVSLTVPMYE